MDDQKINAGGLNGEEADAFVQALEDAAVISDVPAQRYARIFCNQRKGRRVEVSPVVEPRVEVFTSPLKVMSTPVISCPPSVLSICNAIQGRLPGMEFSILLKGQWTPSGFIIATDEHAIPKQDVTQSAVDYDHEDVSRLVAEGYNCVLHSHPMNLRTFSSSDEQTINSNFVASVLYCQGELCDARVCIPVVTGLKLRLKAEVVWSPYTGDLPNLGNITARTYDRPEYGFGSVYGVWPGDFDCGDESVESAFVRDNLVDRLGYHRSGRETYRYRVKGARK